jgi:hypothetical protein
LTELAEDDARVIVQRLLSLTEQGRLEWQVWDQGVYEYYSSSARFFYYLKTRDDDGTVPFVLQIYRRANSDAVEAGQSSDEPPPAEELFSYPSSAYSDLVEKLYRTARAKALGVENLKSDILDDLADD